MSLVRRWFFTPLLLTVIAAGALILRFAHLAEEMRRQTGEDLTAPLIVAATEVEGWMRLPESLRGPIADRSFHRLDSSRRLGLSRTSLLEHRGDSLIVLATSAHDTMPLVHRALSWDATPAHVRRAFVDSTTTGWADKGLVYDDVLFATKPVAGTNWVLLREVETDTLTERMIAPVLIDALTVIGVLLVAIAYVRARTRVTAMRRDQEIAALRADFVAAVSHELRTPIAQIKLFAELLQTGGLRGSEETQRAHGVIAKEAGRLAILVDNVLSYAGRSRGTAPVAEGDRTTDVSRDVLHVVEAFAPLAAEKGVRIETSRTAAAVAAVDSHALRQILLNFLENAVKYGPRGQTVTLGVVANQGRVRISVSDEGPGVPDAERDAIWNAFERGTAARTSGAGGSGIGLSVVRDLVTQHGGTAWVESPPEGGARFVVEFEAVALASPRTEP